MRPRGGGARERRCVATGEVLPDDRLVRFVLGPADRIVPDVAARLPGRGVWVQADRASVDLARRKGGFARSLKEKALAPDDLADQVEQMLARRCLDMLGLGRKAGALTFGYDKVEAAIRAGPPLGLVEASDGAGEGRDKLRKLSFGLWKIEPALVGCFTAAELGVALGRDHVVHACWLQERMARKWAAEVARLGGFRAITPSSWRTQLTVGVDRGSDAATTASSQSDAADRI